MERGSQQCGWCQAGTVAPLLVVEEQGVPPGQPAHAITYARVQIERCAACGGGQIEWLDHDCFDYEDIWDQYEWYVLDPPGMAALAAWAAGCPAPLVSGCACPAHAALRAACRALPRSAWTWRQQYNKHIHHIHVVVSDAGPRFIIQEGAVEGAAAPPSKTAHSKPPARPAEPDR